MAKSGTKLPPMANLTILAFPRSRALLAAALLTATLAGCAEEDNDRPRYTASLDASTQDTQVSNLSNGDLEQVCATYSSYVDTQVSFDALAEATCLLLAIPVGLTAGQDACEARYDECIAGTPSPVTVRAQINGQAQCVDSLRSCNGTVAQLESCVNVNLDFLLNILDTFSCGGSNGEDARAMMDTVNACGNLNAQCTAFTKTAELE